MHQTAIHTGVAPYRPNSIDGGEPLVADEANGGYIPTPRPIEGRAVRAQPASFDDHFSQATLFYRSLSPLEQAHVVEAFTFELGKCYEQVIKERELQVLADVDADLCARVAAGLGLPAPTGNPAENVVVSAALTQIVTAPGPITGRKVGVIADAGSDLAGIERLRKSLEKLGATLLVVAPAGGVLIRGSRHVGVDRTLVTTRSIEFDAVVIADGTTPTNDIKLVVLLQEAFRHCKALGAWGNGATVLQGAGIPLAGPGVFAGDSITREFTQELVTALGLQPGVGPGDRGDGLSGPAGKRPQRPPTLITASR